jgi:hypothetical protein
MVVLSVLLGGCGVMGVGGESVDDQLATLRQRPDIKQISIRYEHMQAELRDRLSADIGGLAWINDGSENRGGCGFEFPDVPEGELRYRGEHHSQHAYRLPPATEVVLPRVSASGG